MSDVQPWLRVYDWLPLEEASLSPGYRSWLSECGSMTARCERHCRRFTVHLQREAFIARDELSEELTQLPDCAHYWLREVTLCGDGVPWIQGRTLVPETSLSGEMRTLMSLGTVPLGRFLFSTDTLARDYIQVGVQDETLWARRSRLRLEGKPLLLTELFLADAPMYVETNDFLGCGNV
ncbi:chorismate lyase [Enterobacillus tribolii]|uniref:Chorismate pyruvate-lyase n=1 Tax=Enterobacillus tribolii TaxID=1487935 RepID=A0A370QGQ3_9GAMM|nr:chorismate lyase [Enterobacillus tribolii]MBW7981856.1 chorismate lyase [Enterobacillus tribolii]RDK87538.1 chorismate lyase [Enterobacillus tribolii]